MHDHPAFMCGDILWSVNCSKCEAAIYTVRYNDVLYPDNVPRIQAEIREHLRWPPEAFERKP